MLKFFLKRWKHNERNLLLREAKYSWISREREKRRKNSAKKLRKLYRRGPCHLPHPLFSPLDGEYFTRRSRTVVHHSWLNRGSIYERYHLFSRPMKFTASIFRHRTRPINILPPSIDRSIDFYPPGKRYQLTLSLHVCIELIWISSWWFTFLFFFFFFGNVDPFSGSRDHQTFDRFWFAVQKDGSVKRRIFDHIDRISNDFREDLRENDKAGPNRTRSSLSWTRLYLR